MSQVVSRDPVRERQQWLETVQDFCDEVTAWSESRGWKVVRKELDLTEESFGTYPVPMLIVQAENGAVMLEPVARDVMGATGRIDLYAYPTLYRVMLLRSSKDGRWRIRTDSGIFLKEPWSRETYLALVADLTGAPDESPAH